LLRLRAGMIADEGVLEASKSELRHVRQAQPELKTRGRRLCDLAASCALAPRILLGRESCMRGASGSLRRCITFKGGSDGTGQNEAVVT
jgi:hypothetical protein